MNQFLRVPGPTGIGPLAARPPRLLRLPHPLPEALSGLQASGLGSFHMANEEPHSPKCDSKVAYLEPNKPANGSDFPLEDELLQVTFEIGKIAFGRGLISIVHMARSNSMGVVVILAHCSIRLRWLSMQFPFQSLETNKHDLQVPKWSKSAGLQMGFQSRSASKMRYALWLLLWDWRLSDRKLLIIKHLSSDLQRHDQTFHGSGEAFRIWPSLSQLRHTRQQTNRRSVRIA